MENEHGFLQVSSTDEGESWGHFINVRRTTPCLSPLILQSFDNETDSPEQVQSGLQPSCANCTSPTSGVGLQLQRGPHKGRLLFIGPHNAYHGDVVVRSDDHGNTCLLQTIYMA